MTHTRIENMDSTRECKCGEIFVVEHGGQKYHSTQCRRMYAKRRYRKKHPVKNKPGYKQCGCGVWFEKKGGRKYCSDVCRDRNKMSGYWV